MGVDVFDTLDESSMKCIRFDVCKNIFDSVIQSRYDSSMKCIRFDVCKRAINGGGPMMHLSSMKCIRFDVCKPCASNCHLTRRPILNEVHTF